MGRSAVTSHQKRKAMRIKKFLGRSRPILLLSKKKSDVVSLTVLELDQGQCPSASSLSSDVHYKKQCTLPGFLSISKPKSSDFFCDLL